jgi:sugar/nucleoside kinase (ribokinase family)
MKQFDICGMGEFLIDFTSAPAGAEGKPQYAANPGGAHPNVLAAAARLGHPTAMLSRVGSDSLGQFLMDTLDQIGVNTEGVVRDSVYNTTLAFVHNAADGDRSFSFYWKNSANTCFAPQDLREDILRSSRILQLGSLLMSTPTGDATTMRALEIAKEEDLIVSFDPNVRPGMWDDLSKMVPAIRRVMPYAHILKVSEEEAELLTGSADPEQASSLLMQEFNNLEIVFVTLGAEGCFYRSKQYSGHCASPKVKAVDTTGCGDSFTGGALSTFLDFGCSLQQLTQQQLNTMVQNCCNIGAYVATKYGGVLSMPTPEQLKEFLKN